MVAAALLALYAADVEMGLGQYLLFFRPARAILAVCGYTSFGLGLVRAGGCRTVVALQEEEGPSGRWVSRVSSSVVDGILVEGRKIDMAA